MIPAIGVRSTLKTKESQNTPFAFSVRPMNFSPVWNIVIRADITNAKIR